MLGYGSRSLYWWVELDVEYLTWSAAPRTPLGRPGSRLDHIHPIKHP